MGGRPGSAMASGAGGIGGGGGGGKIRTRRCHQGPVKPYQQGRPQHQGILSRVTESVKNIVTRVATKILQQE